MTHLTFDEVSETNRQRCARWHQEGSEPWSYADWSNAMMGEVGELADAVEAFILMNRLTAAGGRMADTVKKIRRAETKASNVGDSSVTTLFENLAAEAADVYTYLDLLCTETGVDLPDAIAKKFNEVSIKQGFPERLLTRADMAVPF